MTTRVLAVVPLLATLGCATSPPAPGPAGTSAPGASTLSTQFKIVGYFPTWQGKVEDIQFGRITHLNYAFVLPTPAGGLTALEDPGRLRRVVEGAHKQGVKVSIAIGGWNDGNDKAFEQVAADPALQAAFIDAVAAFVTEYQLDGVDMDWEYPDPGQSGQNFLALMTKLRARLQPMGKLLTMAVVGDGKTAAGIPDQTFALVDLVNIMAYDADEDKRYIHHSPYEYSELCLDFWLARGVPRDKVILGVPFYGKKPYTDYHQIVAKDPKAPNEDQVGNLRYNGLDTIRKKTALAARKGGGIMIWELSQDTGDATSLLRAIREAAPGG
jgi:chitinase